MSNTSHPSRMLLINVPRIKFYDGGPGCPEDITLPSVMRALMEFLGEEDFGCRTCQGLKPGCKINCSYSFFMGVTGAASFLSWKKGWEGDNQALFYMSDDPAAPERRAFSAAGYAYEVIEKQGPQSEAVFRERIIESINRGMPVRADGVIGPPEPCLITGYDEDGDVLIGWNFFQNIPDFNLNGEFEPTGEFRKRDWFKDTFDLLFIGEKQTRSPLNETYRDALQWMLKVARVPMVHPEPDAPEWYRQRANGLAAYDAWVDQILMDEDFLAEDAVLYQRHDVHNGNVGTVAETRWYGGQFLIQAIEHLHYDMSEELLRAAACYAAEHSLMWQVWNLAGGNGNPDAWRKFADPAVRRQMAPIIREARQRDTEAVDHIERALSFYK